MAYRPHEGHLATLALVDRLPIGAVRWPLELLELVAPPSPRTTDDLERHRWGKLDRYDLEHLVHMV